MSHSVRRSASDAFDSVELGVHVCGGELIGEVVNVTLARVTVEYAHTAILAIEFQTSHFRKIYRRMDGRSVGSRTISWIRPLEEAIDIQGGAP